MRSAAGPILHHRGPIYLAFAEARPRYDRFGSIGGLEIL